MNNKLFLKVMMILISFGALVAGAAGQADERLMEIGKLTGQGKPEQALVVGRKYLKDLRETLPEADHPAIGYAAIATGVAAAKAGEHEEAVLLIREGLPMFARMRAGQLWADELTMSEPLVSSLEALKRTDEALAVLGDLLERTRKELARRIDGGGLKVDQPGGPSVSLEVALVNEDSLAGLLEWRGKLQLGLKQWEAAEKDLKEAEQLLKKIHPDEQQARLVKLREGWEQAAREQGKSVRPHLVGRFSIPRTIRFEGNTAISARQIRSALTRSSAYVLASHPGADFEEYLKKLKRCIELGYLANGFPKATVTVDWDETKDAVLARIVEGSRFKKGDIRIEGAKALTVEQLSKALLHEPDAGDEQVSRAEEAYTKIVEQKGLNGDRVGKSLREAFPENLTKPADGDEGKMPSFSGLMTESDTSSKGVWETDSWMDYQPSFLERAQRVVEAAYATEGFFFSKFELKLVPGETPDGVDLWVDVLDEGPALRLGKIHLAGNRINTREELLAYLGLEEGMELKGDYIGRVKRSLYQSGRFLGWEVISRRDPKNPEKIDLLIEVAEEWEAPRLSQPLSREQQVMLKFANWMNAEAGEDRDLVLSTSVESEFGPMELSLAMGRDAMSLSVDWLGHQFRMLAVQEKEVEFVIGSDQGVSFRASFPVVSSPVAVTFDLLSLPVADPFGNTSSIAMGLGFSSQGLNFLKFSVDPTTALSMCASKNGCLMTFENGALVMEIDGVTARFDEQSGHLISFQGEQGGFLIEGGSEVGGVARIREGIKEMSQGVENWAEDKSPFSLFYLAMGYVVELARDEDLGETGSFGEPALRAAAERNQRWEPLAVLLGDITSTVTDALMVGKGKSESSDKPDFSIPIDTDEMSAKLKSGGSVMSLLAFGTYDSLAEYIEPGTWPDLVSREILFYLDGKPFYQKQSIETLLEDDAMGPLGSLLCARLLQQAGNPAAARFVTKARAELGVEGFAKDWSMAMNGPATEDGLGWKILNAVRKLDDDKIDGFLPADPPELRANAKELVADARKIQPGSNTEAIRPFMNEVWENMVGVIVEGMVDDMDASLTPKMDPATVAATVNGHPVLRGAVRLMEKLKLCTLIQTQCSALSLAWRVDDLREAGAARGNFEDCVATLLFAQQMWKNGNSAKAAAIDRWAEMIARDLGENGWDQIEGMGLTRNQFKWWVGTLIAAEAHGQTVIAKEIPEKEIRNYYDRHKDLFGGAEPELRLFTIRLMLEGEGADQRKLASEIRERIEKAETMEQKVKLFMEAAKQHSGESDTKPGGERGWVRLTEEFSPGVAAEIAKVPEESLSEVIEVSLRGQGYLYLALIPEKKRPGKGKSFEQVAPLVRRLAILDRDWKRLEKQADIRMLDEPDESDPGKGFAEKGLASGVAALVGKLFAGWTPAGGKGGEKKVDGNKGAKSKKEPLSLELITRKAAEGSAYHIYLMGTCIERGLTTDEKGIQAAIQHYQKAADGGERKAMLRLSEIYRAGLGVEADERKAQEWKEKALAAPEPGEE